MEAGSSGGTDKNRVYGLSNTTVENLRAANSVLIVGSSQSVSSTKSEVIVALKQQYQQLSSDYEQLRQLVMNTRSQMSGTCALFFAIWSRERLASSSSSSSSAIVLV
jgi:hypothetical protein